MEKNERYRQIYQMQKNKAAFARALGITPCYADKMRAGKMPLSLKVAKKIEAWSGGRYRAAWLLGLVDE